MTTLIIKDEKWGPIRDQLINEYGEKILISFISKKRLGCTIRRHQTNETKPFGWSDYDLEPPYQQKMFDNRLDFVDDRKYTMFLLKYSDML